MAEYWNVANENYINACKNGFGNRLIKLQSLDHSDKSMYEITSYLTNTRGNINVNYNQGTRRTCELSIIDDEGLYMPNNEDSPLADGKKFKISLGLEYKDNTYWWDNGIFVTDSISKSNNKISITGIDKFVLFNRYKLQQTYTLPAGSTFGKIIESLITLDMGNGYPIDSVKPIISPSLYNITLPYDVKKEANSSLGDILTDLATATQTDIYYDGQGYLNVVKTITEDYLTYAPQWYYSKDSFGYSNVSTSYDYNNCKNCVTVKGNNTSGIVYSYTSKNDYPMSPVRVSRIGERWMDIVETSSGYNEQRCKEYGEYLLIKEALLNLQVKFDSTYLPHLEENKLIEIDDNDFGFSNEKFIIQEMTIPFGTEDMTMNVSNINILPFAKLRRLYE